MPGLGRVVQVRIKVAGCVVGRVDAGYTRGNDTGQLLNSRRHLEAMGVVGECIRAGCKRILCLSRSSRSGAGVEQDA
jgi:hypothetical protein